MGEEKRGLPLRGRVEEGRLVGERSRRGNEREGERDKIIGEEMIGEVSWERREGDGMESLGE